MMKKFSALLLALLLLLPAAFALAEDAARQEIIQQLNLTVEALLNKYEYTYEFEDDVFTLEFDLDSSLSSCEVTIRTDYDAVEVIAAADITAPEANRAKMAQYIALLNYKLFYSQFGIRLETGFFYSRGVQLVESVLPGVEELDMLLHAALGILDDYGDSLATVALTGADPFETINNLD